jgi:hypothetical protein
MEALGERGDIAPSFTTSTLDGGEWSASRLGRALPPGKGPPVPSVQEAGWAPEPVWTQRIKKKSFALAGDRTQLARFQKSHFLTVVFWVVMCGYQGTASMLKQLLHIPHTTGDIINLSSHCKEQTQRKILL